MTVLKNIGRTNLSFTTGSKDGEPVVEDLRVGETKNIDIDPKSVQVTSRVNSRQVVVGRSAAARTAPAVRTNRIESPEPSKEGS